MRITDYALHKVVYGIMVIRQQSAMMVQRGFSMRVAYNGANITFRKAEPEKDLAYAYDLFKRTTEAVVIECVGNWPEPNQYNFFKKGFDDPAMQMVVYNGKPVGCFCISEMEDKIYLQRMYLEPAMQGHGIGSQIIEMALEKAHVSRRPLELGLLKTNKSAAAFYKKRGFVKFGENKWEFEMRHKDTGCYVPQPDQTPQGQRKLEL